MWAETGKLFLQKLYSIYTGHTLQNDSSMLIKFTMQRGVTIGVHERSIHIEKILFSTIQLCVSYD